MYRAGAGDVTGGRAFSIRVALSLNFDLGSHAVGTSLRISEHGFVIPIHPYCPGQSSSLLAGASRKIWASRTYRDTVVMERCPVCRMMSKALAPLRAACVANPALSECPANRFGSNPARATARLRMAPTESRWIPRSPTVPWRSTLWNSAPSTIPAASSHWRRAEPDRSRHALPWG